MNQKICSTCKVSLDLNAFALSRSKPDGLDSRCRGCKRISYLQRQEAYKEKAKARYKENREDLIIRKRDRYKSQSAAISSKRKADRILRKGVEAKLQRENYERLRLKSLSQLGGVCAGCNNSDADVLCFDHIHNDGSSDRKLGILGKKLFKDVLHATNKYQILCFNCNLKKSINLRNTDINNISKWCPTCHLSRDTSFFKADKRNFDGLYYECSVCTTERAKELKLSAFALFDPSVCPCGVNDIDKLSLDHKNDDGYLGRPTGLGSSLYLSLISRVESLDKYQVLCMNCNIKKHKNRRSSFPIVAKSHASKIQFRDRINLPKPASHESSNEFMFSDVSVSTATSNDIIGFLRDYHYDGYGRHSSLILKASLNGVLIGVAKFANPIRMQAATSCGFDFHQTYELDRFCIHPSYHKKNFASWFLGRCFKYLKSHKREIRHLISFADPEYGHVGIIYRATNWRSVKSSRSYYYVTSNGSKLHKKTVYNSAISRSLKESEYATLMGYKRRYVSSKIKYIMSL